MGEPSSAMTANLPDQPETDEATGIVSHGILGCQTVIMTSL